MSLTGYVEQTASYNAFNDAALKSIKPSSWMSTSAGPVTTGSRIAFDSATKSQVNDWINFFKTSGTDPLQNVPFALYSMNH